MADEGDAMDLELVVAVPNEGPGPLVPQPQQEADITMNLNQVRLRLAGPGSHVTLILLVGIVGVTALGVSMIVVVHDVPRKIWRKKSS